LLLLLVSFVEVYVTLHWLFKVDCGEARSNTTMYRVRLRRLLRLPVGSVARWNWFAEFVFGSPHSGVSVANGIGAEGANALGDALKDNTTLTSLSLNLYCEYSWFRW
jgi:hypothetical protein